ncbi:MAG: hypothetical protein K2H49_09160 [Muribaculaceae bacterium]|nr:hypothetical protein [Muribaculaceae bacterium]
MNAAEPVDWGEMQPDVEYRYEMFVPVSGYYTPKESGVLKGYSTGEEISVYKDAAHQEEIISELSFYTSSGEKGRVYPVTKGETVYFYNPVPIAGGVFRFAVGKEEIRLGNVDPSPEIPLLSLSTAYRAEIPFNMAVKCTNSKLEINGMSVALTPEVVESYVTINWFGILRQWYREDKIKEGDILTLTLTGIRDAYDSSNRPDFGDGLGKLVLKYKMAARPAELVREIGTPNSGVFDFLSYYMPGSDKGLVSLVFSDELDPGCRPVAEIEYGDPDNIEAGMYHERVPVTVADRTVTVDLQGVTRFPEEMVPGLPVQNSISLVVSDIRSADGQYVLTGSVASPYSFGFGYNFKSVAYSIAADWMPVAGSQLKAGDQMEIWVLNGQHIMFDSVDFSYVKDGVMQTVGVPYSSLNVEKDSDYGDAMLYYLSAPEMDCDADSDITVTFGGLKCADGLDHTSDILVKYKSVSAGVEGIGEDTSNHIYYDLTGRRVVNPAKGIYIRDGRKVVMDSNIHN